VECARIGVPKEETPPEIIAIEENIQIEVSNGFPRTETSDEIIEDAEERSLIPTNTGIPSVETPADRITSPVKRILFGINIAGVPRIETDETIADAVRTSFRTKVGVYSVETDDAIAVAMRAST